MHSADDVKDDIVGLAIIDRETVTDDESESDHSDEEVD